jgi:hypothetical protein
MRISGHLDAEQYQAMIDTSGIIQAMNTRYDANSWVFQHDGASPHRARTTREFLALLCLTVSSDLHWPANSPDLNVIENLWATLKRRMADQDSRTQDELWLQVETVWNQITIKEINHLVQSFASRLQVMITLYEESLNGQGDVHRILMDDLSAEQIIALREEETGNIRAFTEQSREFFAHPEWREALYQEAIPESIRIVEQLPETRRSAFGIKSEQWTNGNGVGDQIEF